MKREENVITGVRLAKFPNFGDTALQKEKQYWETNAMGDAENIKMSTTSATPTTKTTAGTTAHLTARFVKSDQQSNQRSH